jgi:hypothetical protein
MHVEASAYLEQDELVQPYAGSIIAENDQNEDD